MPFESTRTARNEARITPDATQRAIEEAQVIHLPAEDQRAFAEALLNPPPPNAALKRAAGAWRALIKADA